MTQLERARVTRDAFQFILQFDCTNNFYSPGGRNEIHELHDYYERCVAELEAADKGEEPVDLSSDCVVVLSRRIAIVNAKIERLEANLEINWKHANEKINRVESKVEDDCSRQDVQSDMIQKIREWCSRHTHFFETSSESQGSLGTKVWETRRPSNTDQL